MDSFKRMFAGRLNRKYFALSYFVLFISIALLILIDNVPGIVIPLYFFIQLQLVVRRLHDMNIEIRENIIIFLVLYGLSFWLASQEEIILNITGVLLSVVMTCMLFLKKGTTADNKYGKPNQHSSLLQAMFNALPAKIEEKS